MKKPLLFKLAPLLFLLFFVFLNSSSAQHFLSMTDQEEAAEWHQGLT
ncbi:MAG: hypothetical protein WBD64_11305 [Candidatus Zixiibacteriota bacterium]